MSTRLPHKEKYTTETEHLAMQSINHANSNDDASPPNEEDSPKCDSDEIEELETRDLALRRKSTFAQRSTKSKVLLLIIHLMWLITLSTSVMHSPTSGWDKMMLLITYLLVFSVMNNNKKTLP